MESVTEQVPLTTCLRMLRLGEVESRTGLRRATIYKRAKEGSFPRPVSLGKNSSGWVEAEINAWLAERVAARDARVAA